MAQKVFRVGRAVPIALALLALAGCGPRRIPFRTIARGSSPVRYIVIHGNETTAKAVAERHMAAGSGVAFVIANRTRNIRIAGGLLDPNRMFSDEGAERSLRRLNPDWDDGRIRAALPRVRAARERLLADLLPPPGGLVVALHNNTTTTLIEGEIKISSRTSLRDAASPHEFIIATHPADFDKLAELPYNALLQDRPPPPDDGSLSRLAAARGVRYVNIEAGLDALDKQQRMLEAVLDSLVVSFAPPKDRRGRLSYPTRTTPGSAPARQSRSRRPPGPPPAADGW